VDESVADADSLESDGDGGLDDLESRARTLARYIRCTPVQMRGIMFTVNQLVMPQTSPSRVNVEWMARDDPRLFKHVDEALVHVLDMTARAEKF